MVTKTGCLLLALATLLVPAIARADEAEPSPTQARPARPEIHHAPRVSARAGSDVRIAASIERPDRLKRAILIFRGEGASGEVDFARSSDSSLPYVAVIPAAVVHGTSLAYAVELETIDGERIAAFATRDAPHPVTVLDSAQDAREAAILARLDGRRSVVQAGGEYVAFGTSRGDVRIPGDARTPGRIERRSVSDRYYRVEGSFTYRLLGTVSEFGIRAGVVRGSSLLVNESDPNKYDVGLNYGAPRVRLRLDDWCHVEGELLISITEVGFSTGGGGAIILGDAYGSKLTVGGEGIQVFGARGYTRLDIVASKRLVIAPIVEVTNMPHADAAGVRLLGEAGVAVAQGLRLDVRGGYQARSFDQGGPTLGAGVSYAF